MEPRGVRIKRMRKQKRKQIAKAAASSFALSSSIVVGAHFISPTYAQFNSTDEVNSTIEACFIFPRTIEQDFVIKSEEIFKKINRDIQQTLSIKSSITEIDVDGKLKNIKPYSNGHTNPSEPASDSNASLKGLTAIRSALESHIGSLQQNISTAKQDLASINSLSSQISSLIQQLKDYNTSLETAVTNSQTDTEELTNLLDTINGFKDQAITECAYEETYFEERISKMEGFSKDAETLITQAKEEQATSLQKVSSYTEKLNQLTKVENNINDEISKFESSIEHLNNRISNINAQIQTLEQQKQQEDEQKKKAEKEDAEKKKKENKPPEEQPAATPQNDTPSEEKTKPASEPEAEQPQEEENNTSDSEGETTQQNESSSENAETNSEEAE